MAMHDTGVVIKDDVTVGEAIEVMRRARVPAVAIATDDNYLQGIFTNGDMRNYFLKDGDLSAPISAAMNPNPVCFRSSQAIVDAQDEHPYIVYPMVNSEGKLMALDFGNRIDIVETSDLTGIPLVIMAGGKGTRLKPYTDILPKALIPIGEKSVTEQIIDQFHRRGCNDVWLILNHKAEMIEAYFNGVELDYNVHYLREQRFLGTGGGLSLVKGRFDSTFILSNCDILIDDDLSCAYHTHVNRGYDITYVCAMMDVSIPYGVVETDAQGVITSIKEKPELSYLVSTGVYVVEPWVLDLIGEDEHIDFPDLAKRCADHGGKVGVFPIPEDAWIDIGEINKMNSARQRLQNVNQ